MTINAIKSDDRPSIGWATVTMSLEEIEKLRGALCSIGDKSRLHADFFLLFELVQKGVVDDMTHGICIELARKRDEDSDYCGYCGAEMKGANDGEI